MSNRKPAYRVEEEICGCSECGDKKTWHIIKPDGMALLIGFGEREVADEMAEELNRAYELGRESAEKKPAKGRTE